MIKHKGQNPIKELYLLKKELILKVDEYNKKVDEINNDLIKKETTKKLILKEK